MHGMLRAVALLALVALWAAPAPVSAAGVATAAIDFGDEWMKISLVKAGVPMEIVLNTESKRKTNTAVSLRGTKWSFSEEAIHDCIKHPEFGYRYLLSLLGQPVDSPLVRQYLINFPHSKIEAHPERGTVVFRQSEDKTYSVEELVGMILRHAVTLAEKTAEQPITGVVVTVPPFFTQGQRKAMFLAGKIARVNIMQLINTNTAVALHYGIFRRAEFNETEKNIMFYDMGATSTVASIVGFKTEPEKSNSKTRVPQLMVKAVGYDATLGGLDLDLRLRTHLTKLFLEKNKGKYKGDITKNARAQGKLLKEANRVKYILSVNTETYAQVEGLFEEIDFKAQVTRDDLEKLCGDLFARTIKPIEDALTAASMTLDDISQFIIVGGGVRVPKIQQQLIEFLKGKELGKGLNGDEAASLGAIYQAAVLSKSFKVLKFLIKDTTLFPIEVHYTKGKEEEAQSADGAAPAATGEQDGTQSVSRVIFDRFNVMPQKKLLPLRRVTNDVTFGLTYGNLSFLDERSSSMLGAKNISVVSLAGIGSAFESNTAADTKGVKVHFRLDESGLVQVVGAEAVFETMPPQTEAETVEEGKDEEGKADSGKEGSKEDEKDEAKDESKDEAKDEDAEGTGKAGDADADSKKEKEDAEEKTTTDGKDDKTAEDKTEEKATGDDKATGGEEKADAGKTDSEKAAAGNDTAAGNNNNNKTETATKKPPKPEKKVVKIALSVGIEAKDYVDLKNDEIDHSMTAISEFERIERERQARDEAQNILETLIYKIKDSVETPKFADNAKDSELEKLKADANEAQAWLEENGATSAAVELQGKVRGLNETMEKVNFRIRDALSRPDAIKKMKQVLNMSATFIQKTRATNDTEGEVWIKEDELKELERLSTEGQEWLDDKTKAQKALLKSDDPVLTTSAIEQKIVRLERELTFLLKRPKPRPKPKPKVNTTASANSTEEGAANKTVTLDDIKKEDGADTTANEDAKAASDEDVKQTKTTEDQEAQQQQQEDDEEGSEEEAAAAAAADKKKKAADKKAADKKAADKKAADKKAADKKAADKKAADKKAADKKAADKEKAGKSDDKKKDKDSKKAAKDKKKSAAAEEEEEEQQTQQQGEKVEKKGKASTTEKPSSRRAKKARKEAEEEQPAVKLELPGPEDHEDL